MEPYFGRKIWVLSLCVSAIMITYCEKGNQMRESPIYKNPSISIEERVDDLVSRMTLAIGSICSGRNI